MTRKIVAFHILLAAGAFLNPSFAFANHLTDAISHTRDAIEQGKKGDTDALVTHAKAALKSATSVYAATVGSFSSTEADVKAQINAHVRESLINLKTAVSEGKKKHAEAATHQAEEALTHLEAAPH